MRLFTTLIFILGAFWSQAQTAIVQGQLQDTEGQAIAYSNVVLYSSVDSSLVKVETSNEAGIFKLQNIKAGNYFLLATYIGYSDLRKADIQLKDNEAVDLGILSFSNEGVDLTEVTVKTTRAMVEIKPDRTVFNVQGTINSVGEDAISLLRKAPGVTVDNNDNISVLGRTGVLIYVDGKRLPLSGTDLSAYLQNLPAEQIDRIDIISNPGARYEAEGNAGIVDIRLKRDKSLGSNGSLSSSFSQGRHFRYNLTGSGNYRNKKMNLFGNVGHGAGKAYNDMDFDGTQNGLRLLEDFDSQRKWNNYNARVGVDFFVHPEHTIGFLAGARIANSDNTSVDDLQIGQGNLPYLVDSVLVANNTSNGDQDQYTINANYRYDNRKGRSLNIDLDYGLYKNDTYQFQPNRYFDAEKANILTEIISSFRTPTDIGIYTFKVDFEEEVFGGKLGLGSKLSRVTSENTFLVFDVDNNDKETRDDRRSNDFDYDENVYAGYISFARAIGKKWNFSAGLRAEQTDAMGDLQVYSSEQQDSLVELNYLSWFPSAGLTYQASRMHLWSLNFGRRINRPDYNVLNPFNSQLSELSYEKGNPRLNPEIVNNIELGYTYQYRYNFKIAYSKTEDQITRLLAPDREDPRAGFITWANLANQTVISANISAPFQVTPKWNAFINLSASHLDNQADYGDGAVVDLQAFTYSIFQQHTFTLPKQFKAEISGYYSGPGVWGGVFEYESSWSLNLGLQRKFLQDAMNVKLSASDIFFQSRWDGFSEFDGLKSFGSGRNDSRRVTLSLSYNFGNQNVKSRKRKSGLEDEAGRVGG